MKKHAWITRKLLDDGVCRKALIMVALVSLGLHSYCQNSFNITVVDVFGRPAPNVTVTFDDPAANMCRFGETDRLGRVRFEVETIPDVVYLYDSRQNPSYGFSNFYINQSRNDYRMEIPFAPRSVEEVGFQLDGIYENIRKFYGYVSAGEFVRKIYEGRQKINTGGLAGGVPGVFSISPLPVFEDGKPYLEISGILVDFILGIVIRMQPGFSGPVYGRSANYAI